VEKHAVAVGIQCAVLGHGGELHGHAHVNGHVLTLACSKTGVLRRVATQAAASITPGIRCADETRLAETTCRV
jgi:hypothetical protein